MAEKIQMLAKTLAGLEDVLKQELTELGASDVEIVNRGVMFSGSKEILYKANFCCHTALRILRIIDVYKVKSSHDLYTSVRGIPWSDYFDPQQTFAVNSTVNSEAFNNSMFVSLKTKDAIVDQFRSVHGKRPSVNTDNPDIRINVHASANDVTLSLDSSGESLHKRGYRLGQSEASMSEVLAAGILKIAGWKGQCDLIDPMCGSGTLPIEAALIARKIPPGIFRKSFAFEKWTDFDKELFEKVYNADYEVPFEKKIFASDISSVNIKIAVENARNAGLKKGIEFSVKDFSSLVPEGQKGILMINPPYGQRMNDRMVEPLYTMIGDSLKKNFQGYKAWIFSGSEDGLKRIGLKFSKRYQLYNGSIECELRCYDLYAGSMKASNQSPQRPFPGRDRNNQQGYRQNRPSPGRKPTGNRNPDGKRRRSTPKK